MGGTARKALIGRKMDKEMPPEAAKIEGANVEKITDANGLSAVKVTFESGILCSTHQHFASSKSSLGGFAGILKADPTLDIAIISHTDKSWHLQKLIKLFQPGITKQWKLPTNLAGFLLTI